MSAATIVQALTEFAPGLDADYEDVRDTLEHEPLSIISCGIRDCRADLASLDKRVRADLFPVAGMRRYVVEGLGEFEIKKRTKRTGWRHDDLVPAVVARIVDERETLFDPETGELLPLPQIAHNIAKRLNDCISFGGGKVTGLREIGLNSDEFCTETPDGYDLKLPARNA